MDADKKDEKGVYGHNLGSDRGKEQNGIREKEQARSGTADNKQPAGEEHSYRATKDNPRPPTHAPGSDEVPS